MQNGRTLAGSMRNELNGVGLTPFSRSTGAGDGGGRNKVQKVFMYSILFAGAGVRS